MEHLRGYCVANHLIIAGDCGLGCVNCGACNCGKCQDYEENYKINNEYKKD